MFIIIIISIVNLREMLILMRHIAETKKAEANASEFQGNL